MTSRPYDFSDRVEQVPSLDHYLSEHRRIIGGPRTLAQTFVKYRSLLIDGSITLSKQDDDSIRRLNPGKVNWPNAYDWWKAQNQGITHTDEGQ